MHDLVDAPLCQYGRYVPFAELVEGRDIHYLYQLCWDDRHRPLRSLSRAACTHCPDSARTQGANERVVLCLMNELVADHERVL